MTINERNKKPERHEQCSHGYQYHSANNTMACVFWAQVDLTIPVIYRSIKIIRVEQNVVEEREKLKKEIEKERKEQKEKDERKNEWKKEKKKEKA